MFVPDLGTGTEVKLCIQEEVGEEEFGTSRFYDVHSKLEGPCVADLAEACTRGPELHGWQGHVMVGTISPT